MRKISFFIAFCAAAVVMLALASCAAPAAHENVTTLNEDGSTMQSDSNIPGSSSGEGASDPGMSEEDQTELFPSGLALSTEGWVRHEDEKFKFALRYPPDFLYSAQTDDEFSYLEPKPVAAFRVVSPEKAASDVADLEPADLEVRIHNMAAAASLERWLESAGISGPSRRFKTDNISGVEVCASTMIAPGCSYFVAGNGWVYQFIPSSLEGEGILQTLVLLP